MKRTILLSTFIRKNRADIDAAINRVTYRYDGRGRAGTIPIPAPSYTDAMRRLWILNDESLYYWTQTAGVKI